MCGESGGDRCGERRGEQRRREGMGEWKGYVVKREQMKRDMKGERGRETRGGVSRDEERVGGERKRYVLKREWTDEEVQDDIEGRF